MHQPKLSMLEKRKYMYWKRRCMKNSICIAALVVLSLSVTLTAHAQQTDFQSWTLVTAQTTLDYDKRWLLYAEAQPRVGDDISRLERLLLRPAVGYNYTKSTTFYLGYAWTPTFYTTKYEEDFRNEQRIWQQILYKHDMLGLAWQHRLRQEQRFIDDASSTSHRTRYLLRGSYRMSESYNAGLTGYNELFITENSVQRGPRAGFDRNRFFFGPYIVAGAGRYEVGYLGEYGKRFGNDDRMINAIMVAANYNFDSD
jgi:hypothetical protein